MPQEDEEESWLATRQQKRQSWQQRQNELTALQNRIQQLTPILETLPQSDDLPHSEELWRWITGGRFMNNVSHYTASSRRYSNRMFWRRKVCKSPGAV
ncbi:exonuclease, dsDNA, ATP-dependent [Escherichia coli]|uniref:Exonuclease, dsDNA, ATP-dependent n=1 Tax=Escherichia coli TaxID=562 RepID=A0A376RNJ9_ECOLX|nr:exonuclease, dsDNA, ATP-dependent [Escherichia coli]